MKDLYKKYEKVLLGIASICMLYLVLVKYSDFASVSFEVQLFIAVAAYLLIATDIIYDAFKTLIKQHRMSEQFLMMIATLGAFGLKDLPEALAVMVFYKIGEIFEEYASGRAHNEISNLVKLKPSKVRLVNADGTESIVKPRQVKIGDLIRVFAGEAVAIDGNLTDESAAIDTSALTGESEPRLYRKGESVPSGCINQGKVITLKVNTLHKNSSITRLLNLIEDAVANKSRPENLIRRFAVWYTPVVVSAACLLSLVPLVVPDALFSDWIERSLVFLVVSCPCALVLSVPLSFFGGMGAISKIGVIVKGTIHLETLSKLKAIAFDKTGTLTYGKFKVVNVDLYSNADEKTVFTYAKALEQKSTHPVALSVVNHADILHVPDVMVSDIVERAGLGITGYVQGHRIAVGKSALIKEFVSDDIPENRNGRTSVYVSCDDRLIGVIELFDELKKEAKSMMSALSDLGVRTCLITGDRKAVAMNIAKELELDKVYFEQTPQDKLENFNRFKSEYAPAAFTGDGLNDAPVLSCADVGIAMGDIGSACAVETADVVVMHDDLMTIPKTIALSRKTCHLAISNMYLVMGIKILILLLGALGIANIWMAIFGDVGVLIIAVLNAMRTLSFK